MPSLSQEKQLLGSRIRLAPRDPVPNQCFFSTKSENTVDILKRGRKQEVSGKKEGSSGTGWELWGDV